MAKTIMKSSMIKGAYLGLALVGLLAAGAGCASTTHQSSTQSTVRNADGTVTSTTAPASSTTTTTAPVSQNNSTTSTTSTTTTETSHPGAIASLWHGIGMVLAFPFHLIGNVIEAIL